MIWILILGVLIFVIYKINREYKKSVRTNVTSQGGMLQKYNLIISHYVNGLPAKITKVTKDSVEITASATIVYLDCVGNYLEVELRGIAPVIGKYSKKWKFPNNYPQEKMIEEIENYTGWLLEKVMKQMQ